MIEKYKEYRFYLYLVHWHINIWLDSTKRRNDPNSDVTKVLGRLSQIPPNSFDVNSFASFFMYFWTIVSDKNERYSLKKEKYAMYTNGTATQQYTNIQVCIYFFNNGNRLEGYAKLLIIKKKKNGPFTTSSNIYIMLVPRYVCDEKAPISWEWAKN